MKRLIPFLLVLGAIFCPEFSHAQMHVDGFEFHVVDENVYLDDEELFITGDFGDRGSIILNTNAHIHSNTNITIQPYGKITMDGSSGIHLKGNFTQGDEFICEKTSILEFNGDSDQSYRSTSTPPTPYKIGHLIVDSPKLNLLSDMTVMAGGTVEFSNNIVKANEINGRANSDSKLILEATPTEKALFTNIDTGVGDESAVKKNYVNGIIWYQTGSADNSYLFPVGNDASLNLMKLDFPPGTLTGNNIKMIEVKYGYETPPSNANPDCDVPDPKPYTGVWTYTPFNEVDGSGPVEELSSGSYTITLNPRNFTLLNLPIKNFTAYFHHSGELTYNPHRDPNPPNFCYNSIDAGQIVTPGILKFSNAIGVQSGQDDTPFPNNQITIGAQSGRNTINVNWNVEIPKDVAGFNVERSQDGKTFQTVASGIGAESDRYYYNYTDRNVKTNQNYFYRVKVTANGGATTYTRIVQARLNQLAQTPTLEANFYPNPTDGTLNLEVTANQDEIITLTIVDLLGKTIVLRSIEVQNGSNRFDFSGEIAKMSAGTYNIILNSESGLKSTKLVIN